MSESVYCPICNSFMLYAMVAWEYDREGNIVPYKFAWVCDFCGEKELNKDE